MSTIAGSIAGSVAEVVAGLETLDVASLTRDDIRAAYAQTRLVRGWLDATDARLARRLNQIAETNMSILPEADIAAASNSTQSEAAKTTRRAKTLSDVPALEDALAAGDVTAEHVDAVTRAAKRLKPQDRSKLTGDGDRLAAKAAGSTPEQFDTYLKQEIARIDSREGGERLLGQKRAIRLRSWTDKDSGMTIVRCELDPETGLRVLSRIEKTADTLFHDNTPEDCPTEPEAKQDYLKAAAFTRLILRRKPPRNTDNTDNSDRGDSDDTDSAGESAGPLQPDLFSDCPDTDNHDETTESAGESADAQPVHPDTDLHDEPEPEPEVEVEVDEVGVEDPDNVTGLEIDDYDNTCEMMIVIDLDTMIRGLHDKSVIDNGTPHELPIESYRRMACLATIIPAVLDSNGVCVDLGHGVRLANRNQRRALRAMYKTCGIPGCTIASRHCQPHHITWVTNLGPTNLNNLLPLCSKHHHAVHEGGWQLVLHADRSLTITYPDGRTHTSGPPATNQRTPPRHPTTGSTSSGGSSTGPPTRGSPPTTPEAA